MNINKAFTSALLAKEPGNIPNDNQHLFGQFTGEWNFEWIGYNADKTIQIVNGEWIFSWVLEGRVIQDIWIIPARRDRNKPGMPEGEYGTTLRFYSKNENAWKVVWVGPLRDKVNTFIARKTEDEIVMEATNLKDSKMKWIFSEIKENSFHWKSITSTDGENWKLEQEMKVIRK